MEKKNKKFKHFIIWPLLTIVIYGILRRVLYEKISPRIWEYLDIQEGCWFNISIIISAVVFCFVGWTSKREKYSASHIGAFISGIILICLFWFDNEQTPFLTIFDRIPAWPLLFGSFTIGIIARYLYDTLRLHFTKEDEPQFGDALLFQDLPIEDMAEDKLFYGDLAKAIASSIVEFKGKESYSIGITGKWGAGKTSLLNFIQDLLSKRRDFIVLNYSPRQSASIRDIQKDFLNELGEALSKYHSGAKNVTEKYMHAIGTLPDNLWVARVLGSVWDREVEERREEMFQIVSEVKKKIVVLVDDFDRLTGEEVQEVLKLIDKNAAFPGTFYVTAYDKARTNGAIASYLNETDVSRDYTDKYFNLEVSVPIRYPIRYFSILREYIYKLSDNNIIIATHDRINDSLTRVLPFIPKYLSTVRDIKRYVNFISLHLPPVENDVLLGDYLLTTLIRYKFPEEYVKLARHEYVTLKGDVYNNAKTYTLSLPKTEVVESRDILRALFSDDNARKGYRSVTHKYSFDQYFYDYDSRDLKFKDLSVILNPTITPEEFNTIIRPWMSDGRKKKDLIEFVLSYEKSIRGVDSAKRYLRMFFLTRTYCESTDLYIATLSYLLEGNLEDNLKTFSFHGDREYKGFFKSALKDMFELPLSVESIHDALHAVNTIDPKEEIKLIFTPDELMDFARGKLTRAIQLIPEGKISNWEVFRFLRACVYEYIPNGPGESIDSQALQMVKDAILEHPVFFFKDVLCHQADEKQSSSITLYLKEDFPRFDLFNRYEDFQGFMIELSKDTDSVLTNCLAQYADYCVAQKTWTPSISVRGDISQIKQSDYEMYNKLFEGESVDA